MVIAYESQSHSNKQAPGRVERDPGLCCFSHQGSLVQVYEWYPRLSVQNLKLEDGTQPRREAEYKNVLKGGRVDLFNGIEEVWPDLTKEGMREQYSNFGD